MKLSSYPCVFTVSFDVELDIPDTDAKLINARLIESYDFMTRLFEEMSAAVDTVAESFGDRVEVCGLGMEPPPDLMPS